jgi:hypothetical protein
MSKLFFFGCWNRADCDSSDHRKTVIRRLQEAAGGFDFGIVAGDHVYPEKNARNGSKRYRKSVIDEGFDLLSGIRAPLFLCLGNHDTADATIEKYIQTKAREFPAMRVCKSCRFDPSPLTRCILIDSNASFGDALPSVLSNLAPGKWNLVVGHEPPVSFKDKSNSEDGMRFAEALAQARARFKIVYLCADIHNFQVYTANGLPIVVVGTGGAKPDPLPVERAKEVGGVELRMVAAELPYGYCAVRVGREHVHASYVQVTSSDGLPCRQTEVTIGTDRVSKGLPVAPPCAQERDVVRCGQRDANDFLSIIYKKK